MLETAILAIITGLVTKPAFSSATPLRSTCDVDSALKRAGRAIGGDPSRRASSIVTSGIVIADGLLSRSKETDDLTSGRFIRDESGSVQSSRVVFDGYTLWERDWTGGVHPLDGIDAVRGALTDAYLRRYGYLHRNSDAAMFGCLVESAGVYTRYDVVSIVPKGGRKVSIWIDRRSGLVAKTVQRTATSTATTTYDDYREVDGVALPFEIRAKEGSDTKTTLIQHARLNKTRLPGTVFAAPAMTNRGEVIGGLSSTTVPILVENGQILVQANVNGHRLLFQLDTGGHAILTREAARLLHLHSVGTGASGGGGEATTAQQYTTARTLRIGQARIERIPFYVIAYGRDFSDRGPQREPRAGILGLELFERFAVRIDYQSKQLTLTPLEHFTYRGRGTRLPLTFEEDAPLVPARADNFPGVFQVDTGNSGGTILFGPFLRAHHFERRYPFGFDAVGSGTGGDVRLSTRRLRTLAVDGLVLEHFITYFVDQRTGSFSSLTEAGNMGYDVLSQFTTTFDYRSLAAYLEPLATPHIPAYNRTGIVAEQKSGHLVVDKVLQDSPASDARIVPDDWLLQVNGHDGADLSPQAWRGITRGNIGSRLRLEVQHQGQIRHVVLHLRELLCTSHASHCSPVVRGVAASPHRT